MKIIDPSLHPDQFGTLAFEPVADDPRGSEVFALTVNGATVGELAPLGFTDLGMILLDDYDDCPLPPNGCWSLELAADDGRLRGSHILCTGIREMDPNHLTGELAVWATLMVTWDSTGRPPQRG